MKKIIEDQMTWNKNRINSDMYVTTKAIKVPGKYKEKKPWKEDKIVIWMGLLLITFLERQTFRSQKC